MVTSGYNGDREFPPPPISALEPVETPVNQGLTAMKMLSASEPTVKYNVQTGKVTFELDDI